MMDGRTYFRRSSYRYINQLSKSFDDNDDWDCSREDSGAFEDFVPLPPRSAMETLDRRISLSSDQLDTLRQINRLPPSTPLNQFRSRSASRNKLLGHDDDGRKKKQHLSSSPNNQVEKKRGRGGRRSRKTAVDIFLEDEGPYSRTLYGPVEQDSKEDERASRVGCIGDGGLEDPVIQRGLLWLQRDKFFSRWKERFFILTKDYLHCFKKGSSKLTEMGGFIFKLKLTEIESVDLLDKRGYLTICINVAKEGKIYLRRPEGIKEWFSSLNNNIYESKRKKRFWNRRHFSEGLDSWIVSRQQTKINGAAHYSPKAVSSPNISTAQERVSSNEMTSEQTKVSPKSTTSLSTPRGINRMNLVNELISKENTKQQHQVFKKKGNNSNKSTKCINNHEKDSGNDSGHNSINTMSDSLSEDNLSGPPSKVQEPIDNIHRSSIPNLDPPSMSKTKTLYRRYPS